MLDRKEERWTSVWSVTGSRTYRVVISDPDGATVEREIRVPYGGRFWRYPHRGFRTRRPHVALHSAPLQLSHDPTVAEGSQDEAGARPPENFPELALRKAGLIAEGQSSARSWASERARATALGEEAGK